MHPAERTGEINESFELFKVKNKPVVVSQTRLDLSSNAGFLAVSKVERQMGLIDSLLGCFEGARHKRGRQVKDHSRIQHDLFDLLKQRVFQMALGYEDGIDANVLRHDPCLQLSVGKNEALASQPMMSRLENWVTKKDLYRAWKQLVQIYADHFHEPGQPIVLEIDSTEDPVHGQLGLFNGYFRNHCFHPILVTDEATSFPFGIILRDGHWGSAKNAKAILKRIIAWLKEAIPGVSIVIKADSSFGIADLINWFEEIGVDYILGLSGNQVLYRAVEALEEGVLAEYEQDKNPLQRFESLSYRAKTWKNAHPVVAKVEHTGKGINRRFVVSSMFCDDPQKLYGCYQRRAKGIEAIIEQLKNGLRFDKTACHEKLPNQMRYLESALAWILHLKLMEKTKGIFTWIPTAQTLIQKVLKVAAIIKESTRRFLIELPLNDPHAFHLFHVLNTT
ncbi:MAG: IS1380 family transposase [Nitrospiria bacterium]